MKKIVSLFLCLAVFLPVCSCKEQKQKFTEYTFDYFDTAITVIGYEETQEDFDKVYGKIKGELESYHKLFDIYNSYTGINNIKTINDNANIKAVRVDNKIIGLLKYCKDIYAKTEGKTNVMLGAVLSVWHDYRQNGINNPQRAEIPPIDLLTQRSELCSMDFLEIDEKNCTVYISKKGASLDVGAVAKGYACEMIANMLEKENISGYLLNFGGNVRAVGDKNGEKWQVGIEDPDGGDYLEYLKIERESVVTSGSYQRFYIVNGKSLHHIIDPDTLMPSEYFTSVSVITRRGADGDGYSTALFCMSLEDGKRLVRNSADIEAMWVLKSGEIVYSDGFADYCYEPQN